jgi:hypothetical protein
LRLVDNIDRNKKKGSENYERILSDDSDEDLNKNSLN